MARVMKGRLAKLIAQVAALALVVVGLVALVSTQRGAEAAASADEASPAAADGANGEDTASLGSTVLNLERASQVEVTLPKAVTVKSGRFERAFATDATTVEDALRQGQVDFDGNDRLFPAGDKPVTSGMTVTVQRVDTAEETTTKALPFETVRVEDEDLARGKTTVLAEGRTGAQLTTWAVTTVDGKETGRKAARTETVREPVDRRIAVGTKAPAPKPAPQQARTEAATSSSSSAARSSGSSSAATRAPSKPEQASAPASGAWQALANCESGGNWSTNTGNGYYGGLQFSASSWAGAGGTRYASLPHQATPAEQIATAEVLRANGGWGHWPACSAKLGLR
jgi:Transglycosylase-like domain/G5 domain